MEKNTKILLGVGLLAIVGYIALNSGNKKNATGKKVKKNKKCPDGYHPVQPNCVVAPCPVQCEKNKGKRPKKKCKDSGGTWTNGKCVGGTTTPVTTGNEVIPPDVVHNCTRGTKWDALTQSCVDTTTSLSDACKEESGYSVAKFSSNVNLERAQQECTRDGGKWAKTSTGACCKKKNVNPPKLTPPKISTPVLSGGTSGGTFGNSSTISLGGCFVAGTLISMSDETKVKIEDIKIGDEVFSYNLETREKEKGKVTNTMVFDNRQTLEIELVDGNKIGCTKIHPFFILGEGWLKAEELNVGDVAVYETGKAIVIGSIKEKGGLEKVYNISVETNHNYYANGVLVHNKDSSDTIIVTGNASQQLFSQLQNLYETGGLGGDTIDSISVTTQNIGIRHQGTITSLSQNG